MVNCLKIIGGEAMTLVVSWVGIDTKGPGVSVLIESVGEMVSILITLVRFLLSIIIQIF